MQQRHDLINHFFRGFANVFVRAGVGEIEGQHHLYELSRKVQPEGQLALKLGARTIELRKRSKIFSSLVVEDVLVDILLNHQVVDD